MNVLVVGSGGREHALAWRISRSPSVGQVYAAPGNAGVSRVARCVPVHSEDIQGLLSFALEQKIDLTVVGPEKPLTMGIADEFGRSGLRIVGPVAAAARLEGSKVFAKQFMSRHGIPTASYRVFEDAGQALRYLSQAQPPIVVKTDGLAAGKGVSVCHSAGQAEAAVIAMMEKGEHGEAGRRVVIEECLRGVEMSYIVLTDGEKVLPLASSQDHKRLRDNDEGPNTGGMGAFSPSALCTSSMEKEILETVVHRAVRGIGSEGHRFCGFLYAGLMITQKGPMALEFNVRCGDPETQAIVTRMKGDFAEALMAVAQRALKPDMLGWDSRASLCVVMASAGYPGKIVKGKRICGVEQAEKIEDVVVFHAGTELKDGELVTSGGRVLGVTALGASMSGAAARAYSAVDRISWEGAQFRRDIGRRAE